MVNTVTHDSRHVITTYGLAVNSAVISSMKAHKAVQDEKLRDKEQQAKEKEEKKIQDRIEYGNTAEPYIQKLMSETAPLDPVALTNEYNGAQLKAIIVTLGDKAKSKKLLTAQRIVTLINIKKQSRPQVTVSLDFSQKCLSLLDIAVKLEEFSQARACLDIWASKFHRGVGQCYEVDPGSQSARNSRV